MKFVLSSSFALLIGAFLVSCAIPEHNKKPAGQAQPTSAEQLAKTKEMEREKAERKKKKEAEEALKNGENKPQDALNEENKTAQSTPDKTASSQSSSSETPAPKHTEPKHVDYPFALKAPGKEGYVLSPYNNKVVDVRDDRGNIYPSGTLVQDPTEPASAKKYFRVP